MGMEAPTMKENMLKIFFINSMNSYMKKGTNFTIFKEQETGSTISHMKSD